MWILHGFVRQGREYTIKNDANLVLEGNRETKKARQHPLVFCYNSSTQQNKGDVAVTDNILKKSLDVTYKDFLKEIFVENSKPKWDALTTLFGEIVTGKSTLVSDLSKVLRENASQAEFKRAQERVSGWLKNYDFVPEVDGWLLKNIPDAGRDALTFAVDFSDISKVFGGKGMEGMAMGRDGSTGEIRMGHDFICVSLVGADYPEALPVYVKLGRGRKGHAEMLNKAISAVMERTEGKGWIVEDRGMDAVEHLRSLKRDKRKAVIRVKDMCRDAFGDGQRVDASMRSAKFFDVMLHVRTGDRRAKIRCKPGVIQYCNDPKSKDAVTENVNVLVVESRFDGKSIYLYVVCPEWVLASPAQMAIYAERAAQAYCDRWQIETSFYVMKQEFALEKARVRTFKRLENIFTLCVLAYIYATRFLRKAKGFKNILKHLSDNLETVSTKTHALLAGIRALVNVPRLRFISGRPRKRTVDDRQMVFAGF